MESPVLDLAVKLTSSWAMSATPSAQLLVQELRDVHAALLELHAKEPREDCGIGFGTRPTATADDGGV